MAYRLGVDVGGTFTDLFLVSEGDGGAQFRVKTPSTPGDPSEGVLTGVRRICDEAGIGGCPFAPRATGNVATEDLVYLFQGEGIETGIDLEALIGVATWLESILGRELEGQVYKAGTFTHVPGG